MIALNGHCPRFDDVLLAPPDPTPGLADADNLDSSTRTLRNITPPGTSRPYFLAVVLCSFAPASRSWCPTCTSADPSKHCCPAEHRQPRYWHRARSHLRRHRLMELGPRRR